MLTQPKQNFIYIDFMSTFVYKQLNGSIMKFLEGYG